MLVFLSACGGAVESDVVARSDLTETDIAHIDSATQTALEELPSGVMHRWDNTAGDYQGGITPLRTIKTESPHGYCRVYESRVVDRASQVEVLKTLETACRKSRKVWLPCGEDAKSCVRALRAH